MTTINIRPVIAIMLALLATLSCAAADQTGLKPLDWLIGDWVAVQGETTITESWRKVSAGTFEGVGRTLSAKSDSSESLRLVLMGDEVFYIAKVEHNDLPVAFRLADRNAQQLTFSNPTHDFPKQIVYERTAAGSMSVKVSDGAEQGFEILFNRVDAKRN